MIAKLGVVALCLTVFVAAGDGALPLNWPKTLGIINQYRRCHGASDLVLDSTVSASAQLCAEYIDTMGIFNHICNTTAFLIDYGQNLAEVPRMYNYDDAGVYAVKAWYSEVSNYSYANPGFSYGTGHFTQLVWKATKTVGLGMKTPLTTGNSIVVADFQEGQTRDEFVANVAPTITGKPCVTTFDTPNPTPSCTVYKNIYERVADGVLGTDGVLTVTISSSDTVNNAFLTTLSRSKWNIMCDYVQYKANATFTLAGTDQATATTKFTVVAIKKTTRELMRANVYYGTTQLTNWALVYMDRTFSFEQNETEYDNWGPTLGAVGAKNSMYVTTLLTGTTRFPVVDLALSECDEGIGTIVVRV